VTGSGEAWTAKMAEERRRGIRRHEGEDADFGQGQDCRRGGRPSAETDGGLRGSRLTNREKLRVARLKHAMRRT